MLPRLQTGAFFSHDFATLNWGEGGLLFRTYRSDVLHLSFTLAGEMFTNVVLQTSRYSMHDGWYD